MRTLKLTWLVLLVAMQLRAVEPMPTGQQTSLVQKYCSVCHTDAVKLGGLSLEHYDAAVADSALAAMLLSKLRGGAIGAAGLKHPDQATQDAWIEVTALQAQDAAKWHVLRSPQLVTASVVRDVPARIYRLSVSCEPSTGIGEIQLTWSPQPQIDRIFFVSVDGKQGSSYSVGRPAMASAVLKPLLPGRTLTVSELFPGETVMFPVGELEAGARRELAGCFSRDRK